MPTPVGPRKMNEPWRTLGSDISRPELRRTALATRARVIILANYDAGAGDLPPSLF